MLYKIKFLVSLLLPKKEFLLLILLNIYRKTRFLVLRPKRIYIKIIFLNFNTQYINIYKRLGRETKNYKITDTFVSKKILQ